MAQKSQKQLAARNTSRLMFTHTLTLVLHLLYLLLRLLMFRSSFTRRSLLLYILLSLPSLGISFLFETQSRPRLSPSGEVQTAGDDLEQKGVTEWMWDVLYWSWGCLVCAAIFGDWAWWGMGVVPIYSGWLAWSTYTGVRGGFAGMGGMGQDGDAMQSGGAGGQSRRQEKMEKRGGQRMKYR